MKIKCFFDAYIRFCYYYFGKLITVCKLLNATELGNKKEINKRLNKFLLNV